MELIRDVKATSNFDFDFDFFINLKASVYAEKPQKDIHSFIGKLSVLDPDSDQVGLHCDYYMSWSKTLLY